MLNNHGFDMWAGVYDADVEASDKSGDYPFAGYKNVMNAVYGEVMAKRPADVLDIGIGTGTLAAKLYEAGNSICGIDFSAEMLAASRAKMPEAELIRHDFTEGLPHELAGRKFDFIVSTYAFHHLSDDKKAKFIKELLAYLHEGGKILIGDVAFASRAELDRCRDDCRGWDSDEIYIVSDELRESLGGACQTDYRQYSHCSGVLEIRKV